MVKTAVIGASGFLGSRLLAKYRESDAQAVGTAFSSIPCGLVAFDLARPDFDRLSLEGVRDVIIASGKPNIGFCEQHPVQSRAINVDGTLQLIRQIVERGMRPIFLSSDYVFDGKSGGYADDAQPNPSTEYGRQKAAVEEELPRLTKNYIILRLSKIYGTEKGDRTLLDEMAATLAAGKPISAAADQIFCPMADAEFVEAVIEIQRLGLAGAINVCTSPGVSRCELAVAMAGALGSDPTLVKKISLHDLPGMANRPLNTSMRNDRLRTEVGMTPGGWQGPLQNVANNWKML